MRFDRLIMHQFDLEFSPIYSHSIGRYIFTLQAEMRFALLIEIKYINLGDTISINYKSGVIRAVVVIRWYSSRFGEREQLWIAKCRIRSPHREVISHWTYSHRIRLTLQCLIFFFFYFLLRAGGVLFENTFERPSKCKLKGTKLFKNLRQSYSL